MSNTTISLVVLALVFGGVLLACFFALFFPKIISVMLPRTSSGLVSRW